MNARSEQNLIGVHPDLVAVVRRAFFLSPVKFIVTEGLRSKERADQMRAEGKSWTTKSKHLTGHAVDVAAIDPKTGEVSWNNEHYAPIALAMFRAAEDLGVDINWGGEWKQRDDVHFEMEQRKPFPTGVA